MLTLEEILQKLVRCQEASERFMLAEITSDFSVKDRNDLADYFKLPMALLFIGKREEARQVLLVIKKRFLKGTAFKTNDDLKSTNAAYIEYDTYPDIWLLRAACALNMQDEFAPSFTQVNDAFCYATNGVYSNQRGIPDSWEQDIFTTAHHALLDLDQNKIANAERMALFVISVFEQQKPSLDTAPAFYLRTNNQGVVIKKETPTHAIVFKEKNQLYFMLGLPVVFLIRLYEKTSNATYLNYAQQYLDTALACEHISSSRFSHKIAWACSELFKITGEEKYLDSLNAIVDFFVRTQNPDGSWHSGIDQYDQTVEMNGWLTLMTANIDHVAQAQRQSQLRLCQ